MTELWRAPFLPPAQRAERLACRALKDLDDMERHRFWEVEALDNAVRTRGIGAVLTELAEAAVAGPPSTLLLLDSLQEEAAHLGSWNIVDEPQRFLCLWRDRCYLEGWESTQRQTESILFDCGWASLQQVSSLEGARGEDADGGRVGLVASCDGKHVIDVAKSAAVVWDPLTGKQLGFWKPPSEILSVQPLYDDIVAFGLATGELFLWELLVDAQYSIASLGVPIRSIASKGERICLWSYDGIHVLDEDGAAKFRLETSSDDVPSMAMSSDGLRLLCGDGRILDIWCLRTGQRLFSLSEDGDLEEDDEMMAASVLDMGSQPLGLLAMDRLGIWGLDLPAQFDVLQSMSEPMAMGGPYMVSCEGDGIALWEQGEAGYALLTKMPVQDMWGDSSVVSLSDDCRYVAAVLPDGIAAWDLLEGKVAALPLPPSFSTALVSIPRSRLVAVDTGQAIRIFRYVGG
jgi:hypothetical protein